MVLTLPEKRLCLFSLILLKAATTKQVETQIYVSAFFFKTRALSLGIVCPICGRRGRLTREPFQDAEYLGVAA